MTDCVVDPASEFRSCGVAAAPVLPRVPGGEMLGQVTLACSGTPSEPDASAREF